MTYPDFSTGEPLQASDLDAIGMWLVTSQTVGSGVSSVTVTSCFNANYDSYRIIFRGGSSSTGANLSFQLSGITSASYQQYGYYGAWGTAALNAYAPAANTSWTDITPTQTPYAWQMDVHSPFLAAAKYGRSVGWSANGVHEFALRCSAATSATGFTIAPLGGTITGGTIRVYGIRN